MSPEPADVQAPVQPRQFLGAPWADWERTGLQLSALVLLTGAVVIIGTAMWLTPRADPIPSAWDVRLTAVEAAVFFLCGHTVLALRVVAVEPRERRRMVHAAIVLMLASAAGFAGAALQWLMLPVPPLGPTAPLPHWWRKIDEFVVSALLVFNGLLAGAGLGTAVLVIYHGWYRPLPAPTASVPTPRARFTVDQN